MKKIFYPFISLLVIACGSKEISVEEVIATNDITSIRKKKKELATEYQAISKKIASLDEAIDRVDPNKKIPLVTTYNVTSNLFNHYLDLQGSLQTKQNLVIVPEFNGILTQVYIKEGQYVNKGQLLAKIDDGGISQQLAQMEIQTALAKTTFERQKRLWDQKIGSEIQYLQAETAYKSQEEAVKQMKSTLGKTTVRAPFSGIIDDIITEKGSVVAAGVSPLYRIVNVNRMYVEIEVPERYISTVKKGTSVDVEIPVLGKKIPSKIRQAGNFINPGNRTYKIEVAVSNTDKSLKPNLTARLKINDYTNPQALLIPQNLISENANGNQYVYVIGKNNKNKTIAVQRIITTGKSQEGVIEVTKGLKANEAIISEGARVVRDQQVIQILN